MSRRRLHLAFVAAAVGSAALVPRPVAAQQALAVAVCEPVAPQALVDALRFRLDGPVEYRPRAEPTDGTLVLEVVAEGTGARMTVRSADGHIWNRFVSLPARHDSAERVRALALQAGYVVLLASAPGADDHPPGSNGAPPAGSDEMALAFEILSDGTGDLWGTAAGDDVGVELVGRVGFAWPWGLWLTLEAGWQRVFADRVPDVQLDAVPLRLGLGGVIHLESWSIRAALQAIAEFWRVSGEAFHPSGWRGGAGLIVDGAYHIVPWCAVGLEAGLEFLPRAVEVDYRDDPLLALGQFRWRAGVFVSFEIAGL
jgi:hypothetical protein